ncbi:MAG: SEFIR domain-containing protein [Kiritimatiellia bacterium]|jgi:hypothetical protein
MTVNPPKLFISYSWTSSSHEEWVLSLATQLRENGVDVILDKWDLKEGHDAHAFMEKMVTDPEIKKVAMICDQVYAEKADGRSGGVGTEAQILSGEIYAKQDQTKFVAVLPQRDTKGEPFLPAYYKSRVYIDLSDPDLYARNFEQLLRWIYDKPLHVKPELGSAPAFLSDDAPISLQATAQFRRALQAVRENKPYCDGALREYVEVVAENLERFRIEKDNEEFDEKVVRSIDEFLPYRNEAIELFLAIARYRPTVASWESLHYFIESLFPYFDRPDGVTSWQDWDFDNLKFIVHELFLYLVAVLLRAERFDGVAHLVRQHYYVDQNSKRGRDTMVPFSKLSVFLQSLDHRNTRLKLRRLSLHADLLEQRSKASGLFQQIMQADLALFVRDCLDVLRTGRRQGWLPVTLLYSGRQYGPFEIFARSQSSKYFENVKQIFDIESKDDFLPLAEAFKEQKLQIPRWEFQSFNPFSLMGVDKLASLP